MPRGIEVPEKPDTLGSNFETDWARRPLASVARSAFIAGPLKLMTAVIARPEVHGLDRLADLSRLDDSPPLIFAPDHHSHLDTIVMIRAILPHGDRISSLPQRPTISLTNAGRPRFLRSR